MNQLNSVFKRITFYFKTVIPVYIIQNILRQSQFPLKSRVFELRSNTKRANLINNQNGINKR